MVEDTQPLTSSRKKRDIIRFLIAASILLVANILLANYFFRLDLTEDKRYSIAQETKQLLNSLNQDITIDVYLEGDFPARFKRLQNGTRELLNEFQVYSDHINFNFI